MSIIQELLTTLLEGNVEEIHVGPFWTAVVVTMAGQRRCGLASTLSGANRQPDHQPLVQHAGRLTGRSARELAGLACSDRPLEASVGMATINATLPTQMEWWVDLFCS